MALGFSGQSSRLRRKLMIYFLLIAIVSISVSAEIILEISSFQLEKSISAEMMKEAGKHLSPQAIKNLQEKVDNEKVFSPIYRLRNRMILFLLVVSGCIVGAFFMFAKDIVAPMDGMVEAAKRLAEGDLTVKVPVITDDEIGQIAILINEMNEKLLDMINQVKQDVQRHKDKVMAATNLISGLLADVNSGEIIEQKKMKVSDFREMIKLTESVVHLLEMMTHDLGSLETFVKMYKTYKISSEISQSEILDAMEQYNRMVNKNSNNEGK